MRSREYSHHGLSEFATLAESFCLAVTNREHLPPEGQLEAIHRLLPRIYAAGLQLPATSALFPEGDGTEPEDGPRSPRAAPPAIEPPPALAQLSDFLGTRRFYREVFDPYANPNDTEVIGDIVDDLGDIYIDLQRGLACWRAGASGEALWEWRFNFETHWAEHATSALRAIFALSAWHDVPWPKPAG